MPLELIHTYDTIESLQALVDQKNGSEIYQDVVNQAKKHLKTLNDKEQKKYLYQVLRILEDLEKRVSEQKKLWSNVLAESHKKLDDLALQMRLGIDNEGVFRLRNMIYENMSLLSATSMNMVMAPTLIPIDLFTRKRTTLPFNPEKIGKIDPDPMKNNKIVQIIQGVVDEFVFAIADVVGNGINSISSWKIFSMLGPILKEILSFQFLAAIAKEIWWGVISLFNDWDDTKGDLVYRKARQATIAFWIVGLAKGIVAKTLKVWVKEMAKKTTKLATGAIAAGAIVQHIF